jgi:hypothetical protein
MDFLLEMTPGNGWLARENDRIVFLPSEESVDIAHDVIEPLLVPRDIDAAFRTFRSWLETGRPLPSMVLIGLERTALAMAHGIARLPVTEPATGAVRYVDLSDGSSGAAALGKVRSIGVNDDNAEPSGMLIEGVIRAGGFRLHIHTSTNTRTAPQLTPEPTPAAADAVLQLHLDEYSVEIGQGIVLGRWPYKHAEFDSSLEPLIVADPAVSRMHAEIRPEPGGAVVIDKGSHNGTWVRPKGGVDRVALQPNVPFAIRDGDAVIMGDTTVTLGGGESA